MSASMTRFESHRGNSNQNRTRDLRAERRDGEYDGNSGSDVMMAMTINVVVGNMTAMVIFYHHMLKFFNQEIFLTTPGTIHRPNHGSQRHSLRRWYLSF